MAPTNKKSPFNIAFGNALRGQRIARGYKNANDLSQAIEETTGVRVSVDTIRRIESGRQGPNIEQYAAMCLTLNGAIFEPVLSYAARAAENGLGDAYRLSADFDQEIIDKLNGR